MLYFYLFRDNELGRDTTSTSRYFYHLMRQMYEAWQKQGVIRAGISFDTLAANVSIVYRGCVVDWCIVDSEIDICEHSRFMVDLFVNYLRKPSA